MVAQMKVTLMSDRRISEETCSGDICESKHEMEKGKTDEKTEV
jgi:hypothetical protein